MNNAEIPRQLRKLELEINELSKEELVIIHFDGTKYYLVYPLFTGYYTEV